MSERWIQVSERILEKLKSLDNTKDKDRLEQVRSLSIILNILQRSLIGWMQWVNNPDIMSIFSQEDLENMTKKLSDFTCLFVKFRYIRFDVDGYIYRSCHIFDNLVFKVLRYLVSVDYIELRVHTYVQIEKNLPADQSCTEFVPLMNRRIGTDNSCYLLNSCLVSRAFNKFLNTL